MVDVQLVGPEVLRSGEVRTPEALQFVGELQHLFGASRDERLATRALRRQAIADGEPLDSRPETADVRSGDWRVPPVRTGVVLDTGEAVTAELVHRVIEEEVAGIGELDRLDEARRLSEQVAPADECPDFLTLPACALID